MKKRSSHRVSSSPKLVKVPQIDAGSTTDHIWMYYNNTGASDSQDASAVWSNSYASVWHLSQTPDADTSDTGFKSPSATGEDYNQWTNPTNAYASDGNRTSVSFQDWKQDYYNFTFGVPAGATIDGIEVVLEASYWFGSGGTAQIGVELSWDGGTSYTSTSYDTGALTASDADYTLGGATNTWGRSWTDSELSNANFRLRVNADSVRWGGGSDQIDHIEVKIYYTDATYEILDSTANDNDGTSQNMDASDQVAGQIDGSLDFDGSNDYISTSNSFNNPQEFTISAWFKTSSASGKKIIGMEDTQTGTGSTCWDRHLYVGTDGKVYFGAYDGDPPDVAVSTNTLNDNTWHYAAGVRDDATDNLHLYIDGNSVDSTPNNFAEDYTGWWRIGSYNTSGWTNAADGYFTGTIDEVRVSNTDRTADWIEAQHKSMSGTLTSFGDEETQ